MASEIAQGQASSAEPNHPTSDAYASPHVAGTVNILRLKKFAAENLPPQSALRDLLLQEKDQIPAAEFLAKLQVWLTLLRRKDEAVR